MGTSKLFNEVFESGTGSSCRDCDCGKTYFDGSLSGGWDWEEGELKKLQKKAKEHPEKYIEWDCSVSGVYVNDRFFVYNCDCKRAEAYEAFIINEAPRIAEFLNKKSEEMKKKAESLMVGG